MRRIFGNIALMILGVFVLMQFTMRIEKIDEPITKNDIVEQLQVRADVSEILRSACYDCYSNQPKYPWYANIAPVSWNIASHIEVGRSEFNFSEWGTYSKRRKDHKLEEMIEEVESGHMPLPGYLRMHPEARAVLTPDHIQPLKNWVLNERLKLEADTTSSLP